MIREMTHLGDPTKGDAARATIGEHVRVLRRERLQLLQLGAAPARRARGAASSRQGGAQGAARCRSSLIELDDALRDAQTAAQVLVVDKREAEAERAAQAAAAAEAQARRAAERAELEAQVAAKNAEAAPKPTAAEIAVAKRLGMGADAPAEEAPKSPPKKKMGRSGIFGRAAKAVERRRRRRRRRLRPSRRRGGRRSQ